MMGDRRGTVRVMRKRVPGFDEVPSAEIQAEIGQLEELLADPGQRMHWPAAARRLTVCRTALEPDSRHTKVHHHSDCWYVDRYEEGCFPGGGKRQFLLVPLAEVPEDVAGCRYCASGRPAAVKLTHMRVKPGSQPPPMKPKVRPGSVQVGSRVDALDLGTETTHGWTIVEPGHADSTSGRLSAASPIAKAVLGLVVGETAEVRIPHKSIRRLKIVRISVSSDGHKPAVCDRGLATTPVSRVMTMFDRYIAVCRQHHS